MDDNFIKLTEEDFEDLYVDTNLSRALDQVLKAARSGKYSFAPWIPVSGLTGSGKTSIIKSWLKHNKLKNWYISGVRPYSKIEVECFPNISNEPGIKIVSGDQLTRILTPEKKTLNVVFTSDEIDSVDDQTVIVVDDYDRASEEVRKELYNLVRYHRVVDPRVDNEKKTKILNPLMLVVVLDSLNIDALSEEEIKLFGIE